MIEVNGEKKAHNANADGCLGDCLDGVQQVKAELSGKTTVVYEPNKVTVEKIKQTIEDIGYKFKEQLIR